MLSCRILRPPLTSFFFFFNDTATTEIYTLSLHDALPIFLGFPWLMSLDGAVRSRPVLHDVATGQIRQARVPGGARFPITKGDRKSTRLNSSHGYISYAVFCLKKKKKK